MKAPTSLKQLGGLAEAFDHKDLENVLEIESNITDIGNWLQFTYELLTTRKAYHKKQQIKRKMLLKVAEEHLGADEVIEINRKATELADQAIALEVENEDLGDHGPEDHHDDTVDIT